MAQAPQAMFDMSKFMKEVDPGKMMEEFSKMLKQYNLPGVDMDALMPADKARVLPYIRAWADSATDMDGEAVFRAASQFHAVRVASVKACAVYDYVISPTAPMPAFPAELPSPTNDPLHPLEHIGFTVPYNMSEQPAASINCGYTAAGLPIGLQIAGRRFDDLGVLQVARAFELIRDVQRPWPQPPGR